MSRKRGGNAREDDSSSPIVGIRARRVNLNIPPDPAARAILEDVRALIGGIIDEQQRHGLKLETIWRRIMDLTEREQQSFDAIAAGFAQIDQNITTVFDVVTREKDDFRVQIAALNATIAEMESSDLTEDADFLRQIEALKATSTALQTQLEEHESVVVNGLDAIVQRLGSTNVQITQLGEPTSPGPTP